MPHLGNGQVIRQDLCLKTVFCGLLASTIFLSRLHCCISKRVLNVILFVNHFRLSILRPLLCSLPIAEFLGRSDFHRATSIVWRNIVFILPKCRSSECARKYSNWVEHEAGTCGTGVRRQPFTFCSLNRLRAAPISESSCSFGDLGSSLQTAW